MRDASAPAPKTAIVSVVGSPRFAEALGAAADAKGLGAHRGAEGGDCPKRGNVVGLLRGTEDSYVVVTGPL